MNAYQNLIHEIDSLIRTEGSYGKDGYFLNWEDLNEHDQTKVVAFFIEKDNRDLFSITENENQDDIVSALLMMLKKDTHETDKDFLECLKKNITSHYSKRAQILIDERCEEIEASTRWEHGQVKRQDRSTGHIHWSHI